MSEIRTRIAPSPTGNLHVGTARAALFNELFAHQQDGVFVVRVEDTDQERSTSEYEKNILEGLRWLGLAWDEGPDVGGEFGPYRQSERSEHYQQAIAQLLAEEKAYQKEEEKAVYLRVDPQEVSFTDLIRGKVTIHTDAWGGDFVIARTPTNPVFHLAVVVDDAAMRISHVIRGEDHVSNTARHILLQQALGLSTPGYAHLPLLLDKDRRKLSKRAGEVALLAYRDKGYLPEPMLNYLALLGWHPKDDTEVFSHEELLKRFSLESVQKGGAIFSEEKLQAINKLHARELPAAELLERARPFLEKAGYVLDDTTYWQAAAQTEVERVATLVELAEALTFFKSDWPADYPAERLVWRKSDQATTLTLLTQAHEFLEALPEDDYTVEVLEQKLLEWVDANELGRGDTLWPLRVALTGRERSPSQSEVAAVLGKPATLSRVEQAIIKLKA